MQGRKPSWYQSWRAASTGLLWCRWPPWRSRWWRQQCSESQKQAVWGRRRLAARLLTLWTKDTKLTHSLYLISLWQSFKLQKIRPNTQIKSKDSLTIYCGQAVSSSWAVAHNSEIRIHECGVKHRNPITLSSNTHHYGESLLFWMWLPMRHAGSIFLLFSHQMNLF